MLLFFGHIRLEADPSRGQYRSRGPLLQKTSSSDWKATASNRMHSNDLEACEKCCYFWFHSEVKFLTRFGLVILPYLNAISTVFLVCCKVFNQHLFCVISMFVSGKILI